MRVTPKHVVDHYFVSYSGSDIPSTNTEIMLAKLIDLNFFNGKLPGVLKSDMEILDLYKLVSGKYIDDMEIETLVLEIQDKFGVQLPMEFNFNNITIRKLAKYIDKHRII